MINKDMEEYCKKQESHYCNICPEGPVMDPVDFHHSMWICPYCETIRNQTEFDWEYTRIDQHTYCSFKNIFKKNEYFYIVSHYAQTELDFKKKMKKYKVKRKIFKNRLLFFIKNKNKNYDKKK